MSPNKLAIDPSLLAPHAASTPASARAFVRTGIQLSRLSGESWVRTLLTGNASWALERDGLLPLFPIIQRMLNEAGIEEYDTQTVMTVIAGAFRLEGTLESESCYKEVLFQGFRSDPDIGGNPSRPALTYERQRGALLCALTDACGGSGTYSLLIPDAPHAGAARVRATIHDAEHECAPANAGEQAHSVRIVAGVDAFIESLRFGQILFGCTTQADAQRCIEYAVRQARSRRGGVADLPVPPFRVGPMFLGTYNSVLGNCSEEVAEKAVRAVVESIEKTALRDAHALRVNSSGSSPQKKRGEDIAFRADIDYEFHVHFWRCADGCVELASVAKHSDYSIPG